MRGGKRQTTGKKGEQLAAEKLWELGYQILEQNWRTGRFEIDIIAKDRNTLVFVEVKTRREITFGRPSEGLGAVKRQRLIKAAQTYIHLKGHRGQSRFDVISIVMPDESLPGGVKLLKPEIEHIIDAFWSK